jgi:hypothetical protein
MVGQVAGVPHGPGDIGLTLAEAKTHFGLCACARAIPPCVICNRPARLWPPVNQTVLMIDCVQGA